MQVFVKLVDTYYMAAQGMDGVIVKGETLSSHPDYAAKSGDSVFVDIRDMRPFMRPEHHHLCDDWLDKPTRYLYTIPGVYDTKATCEVVDNPFAHWNRIKSGELH